MLVSGYEMFVLALEASGIEGLGTLGVGMTHIGSFFLAWSMEDGCKSNL